MKSRALTCITAIALFAIFAAPVPVTAQVRYSVIDVGTLGGTFVFPNTINNRGQITGISNLTGDVVAHAFFWENGTVTDLGTLGGPISVGAGINESGEVVVGADTSLSGGLQNTICATAAICRMFVWSKGVRVVPDLGTLEGGTDTGIYDLLSFGQGTSFINNRHQVVGQADIPVTDPNNSPFAISRAFLWDRGVMTDLGSLGEGHNVSASAINDNGQVVGDSEFTSGPDPVLQFPPFHAFLWSGGAMSDLGAFPGAKLSIALGNNNGGQVVGLSTIPGDADFHTALWSNGEIIDLGTFPGDSDSNANAINSRGQIVGASGGPDTMRAMLWEDGVGIDLNTLIPASSGWQLLYAIDINARGQITGWGIHNNNPNGLSTFLLTPSTHATDAPGQSARTIRGTVVEKKGMTLPQLFRHRLGDKLRIHN
jgi:probable HAF family extracellular repeat protein